MAVGDPIIDLGQYGKLILPVQVDGGRWYYYWDLSGDGTTSDSGTLNGGVDYTTMDATGGVSLLALFNKNINLVSNPAGSVVDFTYRYASFNGVKVALPLHGEPSVTSVISDSSWFGSRNATAIGNQIPSQGSTQVNTTYDDLLAIWDAYNGVGSGSGAGIDGTPPGWVESTYWSATPWNDGYVGVGIGDLYKGYLAPYNNGFNSYVALEVVDSTPPTISISSNKSSLTDLALV